MAEQTLFSTIQDEFHRITMVHLESKFMSKLDEYTPRLMNLFHSKGGSMGLRLLAILLKTPSNPDINMTRDVIIRCLMLYLGESTDQLLKEYDSSATVTDVEKTFNLPLTPRLILLCEYTVN
ncbi:unnamed protein product [Menidia menidia]|uniref:(Atlantic silverside) hypothetical protein n=1 Tax=Menidia menidia TaxID=238744 RepID=A0A8S4BR43_9TELE|nr:unnamed protein product [Menidia menidia]